MKMSDIFAGNRVLRESAIGTIGEGRSTFPVLLDPSPTEIKGLWNRLAQQGIDKHLRGFVLGEHFIVWSGMFATHDGMDDWLREHAGLDTSKAVIVRFALPEQIALDSYAAVFAKNAPYLTDPKDPRTVEFAKSEGEKLLRLAHHPKVARAYGGAPKASVIVFGLDSEILGKFGDTPVFESGDDRWRRDQAAKLAARPAYQAALVQHERRFFAKVVAAIRAITPEAVSIYLHGSRAIGEHKRTSDWDFVVFVPVLSQERNMALHVKGGGGLADLSRIAGRRVDVQAEADDSHDHFSRIVREEGFPIWQADSAALTESRRLQTEYGRFLLNPSKAEFDGFFRGRAGAAFYLDTSGDVALGAGNNASIDHSTVAEAFGLGAEVARGYITKDGHVVVEVWAKDASDTLSPKATAQIDAVVQAAKSNPVLARLASTWQVVVFNADYVEIMDRAL